MSVIETRAKVLETAKRLFVDRGLQATSMSLISKTAGVSMGSIYNLFKSKEELITAIYIDCRERLTDERLQAQQGPQETLEQYFKRVCSKYMDAAISHPYDFKFLSQYHLTPAIDKSIVGSPDIALGVPEYTMSYYIKKKIFKPTTPLILDYICLGIISQIVKAHHAGFLEITEDMRELILDVCWDAISNNSQPSSEDDETSKIPSETE